MSTACLGRWNCWCWPAGNSFTCYFLLLLSRQACFLHTLSWGVKVDLSSRYFWWQSRLDSICLPKYGWIHFPSSCVMQDGDKEEKNTTKTCKDLAILYATATDSFFSTLCLRADGFSETSTGHIWVCHMYIWAAKKKTNKKPPQKLKKTPPNK